MPETDLHSKQIVSFMEIRMKIALFSIFGISYSIVALLVFLKRQRLRNFEMVSPKRSTKKLIFSQWFRIANVAKYFKNYKRKKMIFYLKIESYTYSYSCKLARNTKKGSFTFLRRLSPQILRSDFWEQL